MPLDADDIADLYARHARQLVAFFARRTYDPDVAVELMAETFAAVVAGRARFRGSGDEAAAAWLYGDRPQPADRLAAPRPRRAQGAVAARPGAAAALRRRARAHRRAGRHGRSCAPRSPISSRALAPDHRAVLQLRVVQEVSYEDIAARLGISEQTVRARVSRALRALGAAVTEAGQRA